MEMASAPATNPACTMLVISACRVESSAPSRIMSGMIAAAVNHRLMAHICETTSSVIEMVFGGDGTRGLQTFG